MATVASKGSYNTHDAYSESSYCAIGLNAGIILIDQQSSTNNDPSSAL